MGESYGGWLALETATRHPHLFAAIVDSYGMTDLNAMIAEASPEVAPMLAAPAAGRVVDVGCGGGLLSEAMARRGARVPGSRIDVRLASILGGFFSAHLAFGVLTPNRVVQNVLGRKWLNRLQNFRLFVAHGVRKIRFPEWVTVPPIGLRKDVRHVLAPTLRGEPETEPTPEDEHASMVFGGVIVVLLGLNGPALALMLYVWLRG